MLFLQNPVLKPGDTVIMDYRGFHPMTHVERALRYMLAQKWIYLTISASLSSRV